MAGRPGWTADGEPEISEFFLAELSALLNLPDPGLLGAAGGGNGIDVGGLDIIDSPSPVASLGVAVVAAAIAGCTLGPLDMVRTRYASPLSMLFTALSSKATS